MKFLKKVIKKCIKRLRAKFVEFRRKRDMKNHSFKYEYLGESFSEYIIASPDTRNLKKVELNTAFCESSVDSGIGETPVIPEKKKKLQFTTVSVHVFRQSTLERNFCQTRKDDHNTVTKCRAKYFELPSPQKPTIINMKRTEANGNSVKCFNKMDPYDVVKNSTEYSNPVGEKSPPKPPRMIKNSLSLAKNEPLLLQTDTAASKRTHATTKLNSFINTGELKKLPSLAIDKSKCFNYMDPYDVVKNSTEYSIPVGEKSPPKPPRMIKNSSSLAKNEPLLLQTDTAASKHTHATTKLNSFINSGELKKLPYLGIDKSPVQPEPIHAKATLKKLRQFISSSSSSSSSPVFKSGTKNSASLSSNYSQDFLPKTTSSFNDILETECKESLNQMHTTTLIMDSVIKEPELQNHAKSALEKKFVANLFESRPSKRWGKIVSHSDDSFQKQTFTRMSLDSKKLERKNLDAKDLLVDTRKLKMETNEVKKHDNSDQNEKAKAQNPTKNLENYKNGRNSFKDREYLHLKLCRDIECSRITQTSQAIKQLKGAKVKTNWKDILFLEKILLESSERANLLTQRIVDNIYSVIKEPELHRGTIQLSNIKFPFSNDYLQNHKIDKHFTRFFVVTIFDGARLLISDIISEAEPLTFEQTYIFNNVSSHFELKLKLFCIKLRTSQEYFWRKLGFCTGCRTSKIIYKDQLTRQYQEKTVLISSFKPVAEITLTSAQINNTSVTINSDFQIFDGLKEIMEYNLKCTEIDLSVCLSGFLDVGTLFGETYFWEKKWCVLKGANLAIYNYPQDEDFDRIVEQINLEYCFGPIVTKIENCPRRRCFHLKTARPNGGTIQHSNISAVNLKSKPNFALRKFFFATRDNSEYLRWTTEIEKLLNTLRVFKKLIFYKEYDIL